MPSIATFDHVSLSVTDLDASIAWYRDVLGFTVAGSFDRPAFSRARLHHPEGDVTLSLTCHHGGPGDRFDEHRTGLDHVAFRSAGDEGILAWKRHFEDLGVAHSDVREVGEAGGIITLRDPDGVQVEVVARR